MITEIKKITTMQIDFTEQNEETLDSYRAIVQTVLQKLNQTKTFKMCGIGSDREYTNTDVEKMIDFIDDLMYTHTWELFPEEEEESDE